jgi:type I restriction enzyme S subunit
MKAWPKVALGEMLQQIDRSHPVEPTSTYRLLGVRLEGNGPFIRETVTGTETAASRFNKVQTGDFIYSRLFAWRGAFGVIDDALNHCFVSNEFPIFRAENDRLDIGFLALWFKLPSVWKIVEANCTGSTPTTRNRFKEQFFFDLEIPLPSLPEQQAIVAHVDALAEKTREVEAHLDAVERDAEHLLALRFRDVIANAPMRQMAYVAPAVRRPVEIDIDTRYREVGARSFGKGLFVKPAFDGAEATWQKPVWIRSGDLVLSNIKAWEGAIAVAAGEHDGCIASHRYITCIPDPALATVGFLAYYLLGEEGLEKVGLASPGTADRNRTLSLGNLGKIEVPVPTLAAQQTFDRLQAKVAALKVRHAAIRNANAALLPGTLERLFAGSA